LDLYIALALQIVYGIANLVLISLGLASILGMMRVINLAHGEFLMLGGYTVVISTNAGVNIWLAMLILAPLVVGIIGVIVERVMIRFLYGRMVDTLLATWGLSLVLIGLVTTIFGAQTATTISPPIGAIQIGVAVRTGTAPPDISDMDRFIEALRAADPLIYTLAASGEYMVRVLT